MFTVKCRQSPPRTFQIRYISPEPYVKRFLILLSDASPANCTNVITACNKLAWPHPGDYLAIARRYVATKATNSRDICNILLSLADCGVPPTSEVEQLLRTFVAHMH